MQRSFRLIYLIVLLLIMPQAFAQDEATEVVEGEEAGPSTTYFSLKPAFVLNYGGAGRLRYLKTEISLRVKTGGGSTGMMDIRQHLPYIRHVLVMYFSKQTSEDMSSMEGRELLRQGALEEVRRVLMEEEGKEFVADLLFDSFIVQR